MYVILNALESFCNELRGIVVESTYNWYAQKPETEKCVHSLKYNRYSYFLNTQNL